MSSVRCCRCLVAVVLLLVAAGTLMAGCGSGGGAAPGTADGAAARQVLDRAVANLLSWRTYRYRGVYSMEVGGEHASHYRSTFDTTLVQNGDGALDGHMVVESPDFSYETYSFGGQPYTRIGEGAWYRGSPDGQGADGMVSTAARRTIARFGELAEEVHLAFRSERRYVVSMTMGDAYYGGSRAPGRATSFDITVDRRTMNMTHIVMRDSTPSTGGTPAVSTLLEGDYSAFDAPVDITPPAEVLAAEEQPSGQ